MKDSPQYTKRFNEYETAKRATAGLGTEAAVSDTVQEMGEFIQSLERDPYFRFKDKISLGLLKDRYDELLKYVKEGKHKGVEGTFEFWNKVIELEDRRVQLDHRRRGRK